MSSNDLIELFIIEFEKLENLANQINSGNELLVNQIVEIYYQITNVSSMIEVMKQQIDKSDLNSLEKISNAENSISEITKNLQSLGSEQKSKETIENEAKLYEKLREIMSTKEFVKQYDAGLSND